MTASGRRHPAAPARGPIPAALAALAVFATAVAHAVPAWSAAELTVLWAIQPGDHIVAFDVATFAPRDTVKMPRGASYRAGDITVDGHGRVLWTSSYEPWFWDGTTSRRPSPPTHVHRPSESGTELRIEPQWLIGSDGTIVLAENDFEVTEAPGMGETSVTTRFHVELLDAHDRPVGRIVEQSFPPCSCVTGACSESCPEGWAWAPRGFVDSLLFLTHVVPGQLGSTYGPSFRCTLGPSGWSVARLEVILRTPLDATMDGTTVITAVEDGGCCGWENESSNETDVFADGAIRLLFDEWPRFHNQDYDVSFFTSNARIAPGRTRVGYTIRATYLDGPEIRLSSDGHADSAEYASIKRTLDELPMVEIVDLENIEAPPLVRLLRTDLVGWLDDSNILMVSGGVVVALDLKSGRRRESTIRVRNAADVFLPPR